VSDVLDTSTLTRWLRQPLNFITEILRDPETGKPFVLLDAERAFLEHAYQTDDSGRLVYPEQLYGAPKKSGKTGFAAMHLLTTTLVFGGRFAEGYCIANDLDQAQGRVFQAVRRICEASPHLRRESNITQTRIEFPQTGAVIQAIGSDYAGSAGANPVISSFDELWGYTSERSRRLWAIEKALRDLVRRFAVRGVFYDPWQMTAVAQRLQQAGIPMRECPQSSGYLTEVGTNLYELIKSRGLLVYSDPDVRLAILRAVAVETGRGWRIAKEKAAHKIDVVVALAMAAHAAMTRQWDEEVSFHAPFVAGTPRSIPGADPVVVGQLVCPPGPNPWPSTPAAAAPSALAYDYNANDDWKNWIEPDGSIRTTSGRGKDWSNRNA
jgi:phage terminase large subunit-like protein